MNQDSASLGDVSSLRIAVIGGAGQMGSWFVRYFTSLEFPTFLADVRLDEAAKVAKETGAMFSETNRGAIEGVNIVLVCVPIKQITDVVLEVAPQMKEGAVLAEVSSIKGSAVDALVEASRMGIKPLSIHPLFGPSATSLKGKTIVVVPVVDKEQEMNITRRLFGEADILISGVEEHDRAMAVVLSLTYFVNLVFAKVLS
jgi:prephenate dehydrogenase